MIMGFGWFGIFHCRDPKSVCCRIPCDLSATLRWLRSYSFSPIAKHWCSRAAGNLVPPAVAGSRATEVPPIPTGGLSLDTFGPTLRKELQARQTPCGKWQSVWIQGLSNDILISFWCCCTQWIRIGGLLINFATSLWRSAYIVGTVLL